MEKMTVTIQEIIENNGVIFDFNYPTISEEYKKDFEQNFIDYFYYDEIGVETVARFKHNLKSRLNLIMPYWNKIIEADNLEQRILDNYDVTETYTRDIKNIAKVTSENVNKALESDTPRKKIDIDTNDFVSNIVKNEGNALSNSEGDTKEEWTRKMTGNIGIQTDASGIVAYWTSLRKIQLEIFKECEDLFMGVF